MNLVINMSHRKKFQPYIKFVFIVLIVLLLLRLTELFLISKYHGFSFEFLKYECKGFIFDLIRLSPILVVLHIIFYLFPNRKIVSVSVVILLILSTLHILIIKYFSYQLELLDIFLFKYSFQEINYTINTSGINYFEIIWISIILISSILILSRVIFQYLPSRKLIYITFSILILLMSANSIPTFINTLKNNKFTTNKSIYFYSKTLQRILKKDITSYDKTNSEEFQNLYNSKEYINLDYPLVHKFDKRDVLGPLFTISDTSPNIVILIVEGLNNDFLNTYKGLNLMPFLNNLSKESLYWDKCFTLGERSFAAVPSIIGGLPYGEKGFTILNKYPYHHSLISVLNSNNYYTSFFYGQGSWFHNKEAFFNYNNIDLIFDKRKFSPNYDKIIVNEFFWGYNDKDLFNQAFEVIDTLPKSNRFDLYFTGTSHSPYEIPNKEQYNKRFNLLIKNIDDKIFFNTYKKFIKSILFVDDALKDFFEEYRNRPEFKNTIFIITGDHPMTEIPIQNSIKRYHVPLLIYSPLLKQPKSYHSIVSHLDIYETILAFFKTNYKIKIPELSSSLGSKLDTTNSNNSKKLAFMNDNRDIVDFYSNGYFISNQDLYIVNTDLSLSPIKNDSLFNDIQRNMDIFKKTSLYVCSKNKLISDTFYCKYLDYKMIYSDKKQKPEKFNSEYHNIIEKTPIENKNYFYEISFSTKEISKKNTSLVYQVTNSNDSILFWGNTSLNKKSNNFQIRTKIPIQITNDSILFFQSYFWNRKKETITYSDLNSLIYSRNNLGLK